MRYVGHPLLTAKMLLVFGWLLLAGRASAQGVLPIDPVFFHVDSVKKLILVNASTRLLNSESTHLIGFSSGGNSYTLAQPVASVSPGQSYKVIRKDSTYTLYFTRVPIIQLTARQQIIDTPSVYARFVLIDTAGVKAQSGMGIEFRGTSSQAYPKKSYELSMWADTLGAQAQDLTLLGMRTSDKWNLQAMYNDQLRARLKVANEVWEEMDQLYYHAQEPDAQSGIALAYAEVFINNSYRGIYALTERVDRKQLKLAKYTTSIEGELYKGIESDEAVNFSGVPVFNNASLDWGGFEYKEPTQQIDWSDLRSFVDFVVNSSATDFYSQYQTRFQLGNAVDYYIFMNLVRATDNTGKNLYIARYKLGEPYYYVPWDLDGVLGNDWQGINANITNDILTNGFYTRLVQDCSANGFRATLTRRWAALRTTVITKEHILEKINTDASYLSSNGVFEREHLAWPDYQYDATQLTYAADWLANRLAYLDAVFNQPCTALATAAAQATPVVQLYPNPASGYLSVEVAELPGALCIRDVSGRVVLQAALISKQTQLDISGLAKGLYLAAITNADATVVQKLLVN